MTHQQMIDTLREAAAEYFRGKSPMTTPESVTQYLEAVMFCSEREQFGALFLDNRHQVISFEIMFAGTVDCSAVYPREIAKKALLNNAAAVIVTHNHPGGSTIPSANDIKVTAEIKKALQTLQIRLLDHIIISKPGESTSMQETGDI